MIIVVKQTKFKILSTCWSKGAFVIIMRHKKPLKVPSSEMLKQEHLELLLWLPLLGDVAIVMATRVLAN